MKKHSDAHIWWSSLRHQGLLISPAVMVDRFPDKPEQVFWYKRDRLRDATNRLQVAMVGKSQPTNAHIRAFLDHLLESLLGYPPSMVKKQGQFSDSVQAVFQVGSKREVLKPERVIARGSNEQKILLLVGIDREKQIGRGRGRTGYARFVELLRGSGNRLGLLTNGRQIRLIYAGMDFESWCEWEIDRWFDNDEGDAQLNGLALLLSPETLHPTIKDKKGKLPASLLESIEESRRRQADLSGVLGEAVRRSVERLTDELSRETRKSPELFELIKSGDTSQKLSDTDVNDALLQASIRIVMRVVVCLFAESRGMLPVNELIYSNSYGVRSLFESLEAESRLHGEAKLFEYKSAWPRLVALFRLIYQGSPEIGGFNFPRYGGLLFRPGNLQSSDNTGDNSIESDPVLRALYVFEREITITDHAVYHLLRGLMRGKLPVVVGRVKRFVDGAVDYTNLRTEFIGIIYEGLLDYRLKRVVESPQVFLNIGAEPVLPLDRLEGMLQSDKKGLKNLLAKLNKEKGDKSEKQDDGPVVKTKVEPEKLGPLFDENGNDKESDETDEDTPPEVSLHLEADQRARAWAKEAIVLAGLAPKKRKNESDFSYRERLDHEAEKLIKRVVGDGEFYLIRSGAVRKGSGTFYTKPQLAVPTVHRILEPLCYETENSDAKIPRLPSDILSLKVCDPACGSASFLVAALHYLTEALYSSLRYHCDIESPDNATRLTLPLGEPRTGSDSEELLPFSPNDPDFGDQFEDRVKSILRRHVVERCIYGVDINPLAVEFARVSLWIETMDPKLPFGFLDHKIKVGNALVGCWLDQVLDYPVAAWLRDGGDGKKGERTNRIEEFLKGEKAANGRRSGDGIIKKEMRSLIERRFTNQIPLQLEGQTLDIPLVANEAQREYLKLHQIAIGLPDDRERQYRDNIQSNPQFIRLKAAMDEWCAVWFWNMDETSSMLSPTPLNLHDGNPSKQEIINQITAEMRFFHWELEFPEVFSAEHPGFNAVVGNPPWETIQQESMEFFSEYDPIYRTYDKQTALKRQKELFEFDPQIKQKWDDYCERFAAFNSWIANCAKPFDLNLAKGKANKNLKRLWEIYRESHEGFLNSSHPFIYQGTGKNYTHRIFHELAYQICSEKGRFGLIVPSSLYTDHGMMALRKLFMEGCTWDWLFSFENRKKIFNIHGSFKFASVIIDRKKTGVPMKASFMVHDMDDWEAKNPPVMEYDLSQISLFSPRSKSIPEVRTDLDLAIAKKIYANSFRISDNNPEWEVKYTQEFNLTTDSNLFKPRPRWEERGYKPDVFGRWIGPDGDVALPLYEGRMIGQFDFSEKGWVSGKGRTAVWREIEFEDKSIEPQYLMDNKHFDNNPSRSKVAMMDITSATNERTVISSYQSGFGCGHSIGVLYVEGHDFAKSILLSSIINSFTFDQVLRNRHGGLHMSWFLLQECPMPDKIRTNENEKLITNVCRHTIQHRRFAPEWLKLKSLYPELESREWKHWWAVTETDRLRLRVEIDALVADLYGLDPDDYDWIVRDDPTDPKGFWRVDKELPYRERLTGLSAVAFRKLKEGAWNAEIARDLTNDEFFNLLDIPELTDPQAAHAKGLDRPLIYKRQGCHEWKPELFPEDDPRYGWTWEHCWEDAVALLGSEEAVSDYIEDKPTPTPSGNPGRKSGKQGNFLETEEQREIF